MLIKTTGACGIQMSLGLFDGDIGIDTGFFLQAADTDEDGVEDVTVSGIRSSGLPSMLFLVTVCLYCE